MAALLHKAGNSKYNRPIDYVGFEIPDRFVIGYVGRLSPEKNVRFFAELERALVRRGWMDYRLLLIGEGSERDWLRHTLRRGDLPGILRWFTANIGVHHVHHLNSRIPFYRLPEVLRNHPELADVSRLSLAESFGCMRLALWDESRRRLVSFREAMRSTAAAASA